MLLLCQALVVGGAVALLVALWPTTRVIGRLPAGRVRVMWQLLFGLIVLFCAAYVAYVALLLRDPVEQGDVLVSAVFLFGAAFVLVVTRMSLGAVDAIRRVRVLEHENITDPLMGIHNRRYFDRRLAQEVSRTARYGGELSLLMLDVDHFKRVNDDHGHRAGDAVLAGLGELLGEQLRASDVAARYGGEEVAVIATNTGSAGARVLAERIREVVEAHRFVTDDGELGCTISIGAASVGETGTTPEQLVAQADAALYRAKSGGRNRVEMSEGQ